MKHTEKQERNKEIVSLFPKHTLYEIATKFNLTHERVRQIVSVEKKIKTNKVEASLDTLRNEFKKFVKEHGYVPAFGDVGTNYDVQINEFKSLKRQYINKGFNCKIILSNQQLLENLRNLAMLLGRTPCSKDIRKLDRVTPNTYHNRFGSLKKAQKLAGLKPNTQGAEKGNKYGTIWTDEKIKQESEKYVTRYSFRKYSHKCYYSAYRRGILDDVCKHMV